MKKLIKLFPILFLIILYSCQNANKITTLPKRDKPLIDTKAVIKEGLKDMNKKIEDGPKPKKIEITKEKRKTITTQKYKNYVTFPAGYRNLKQKISINFQNLDFKYAMGLMAEMGNINILVGDEVSGTINAKIKNVAWDVTFQTLLNMKNLGSDIDVENGIIRVHSPENITSQESFNSSRAEALKKKVELEETFKPMLAEIFNLYYISPAQAKTTLEDLFASQGTEGQNVMTNLKITVEDTTRSIIVRGYREDLDVIDKVIKEIDVKTKQVLIEAFVVDVTSTFAAALGSRIGAMTKQGTGDTSNTTVSGTIGGAATTSTGVALSAAAGTVSNNTIVGATSGIGIIKTMGASVLKVELEALQSMGLNEILSSPSVFTLNNQEATITQGTQVPYQTTSDGTTTTAFKEAALSLTVTPSIIGDGNVLMDIKVNDDSPDTSFGTDEPAIKTNEIKTKLLVSDGDIVVIGGIKKNTKSDTKTKTPGLADQKNKALGNLFKSRNNTDTLTELLIFIAPKVIE